MIFASGLIGLATPAATPVTGVQGHWKLDESVRARRMIDGTGLQNGTYRGTGVTLGRDPMTTSGNPRAPCSTASPGYGSIPHIRGLRELDRV